MVSKTKAKQIFLGVLLVIVTILVIRKYLPMVELPTSGRIQEEQEKLSSLMMDLAVQQKTNDEWNLRVAQIRKKASAFWVRTKTGMPLEQEVVEEFNNVARLASVNIQSKEPKLVKSQNMNYLQEVELRVEMRGITMKEFTRLLKEISRNKRKFYWASCKIDPDNIQKPTGIRVTGRLKAYVLTEEAVRLLGSASNDEAAPAEVNDKAQTQSARHRTTGTSRQNSAKGK